MIKVAIIGASFPIDNRVPDAVSSTVRIEDNRAVVTTPVQEDPLADAAADMATVIRRICPDTVFHGYHLDRASHGAITIAAAMDTAAAWGAEVIIVVVSTTDRGFAVMLRDVTKRAEDGGAVTVAIERPEQASFPAHVPEAMPVVAIRIDDVSTFWYVSEEHVDHPNFSMLMRRYLAAGLVPDVQTNGNWMAAAILGAHLAKQAEATPMRGQQLREWAKQTASNPNDLVAGPPT